MTNIQRTPNRVKVVGETTTATSWFAALRCCQPNLFDGHIKVQFASDHGHVEMDLTRELATGLAARLLEALAVLPSANLGGHAWAGDEEPSRTRSEEVRHWLNAGGTVE